MFEKIIKKLFKKEKVQTRSIEENMVYMASLGIPFEKIIDYKKATDKIKEFEDRMTH